MSTNRKVMISGLPTGYWVFRNLVTWVQLAIILALAILFVLWLITDNHGLDIWEGYLEASRVVSNWANNTLRLPWES